MNHHTASAAAAAALQPVVRPWDSVWPTSSGSQGGVTDPTPHGWTQGGGGRGQRSRAGPKGLSQSPCSIRLPHPSPVHILRRAETASHAETNVKINHHDLSCSAFTCSPLVTFPFHSSSQAISSPNTKDPFTHWATPLLHSMQNELQPQCLPLALSSTAWLYGAAQGVCASEQLRLMSHLDNEVWFWQDLSSKQPLPTVRTWWLESRFTRL